MIKCDLYRLLNIFLIPKCRRWVRLGQAIISPCVLLGPKFWVMFRKIDPCPTMASRRIRLAAPSLFHYLYTDNRRKCTSSYVSARSNSAFNTHVTVCIIFGLWYNNKWCCGCGILPAGPQSTAWFEGWRPIGVESVFIKIKRVNSYINLQLQTLRKSSKVEIAIYLPR